MGNKPGTNASGDGVKLGVRDGNILLVEDSSDDIELTLRALKRNGFKQKVVTMRDGAQALDYLRREGAYAGRQEGQPALVLLDLKLPRLDGLQLLAQIKADPQLKSLPVVMLTSSRQDRDIEQAYRLGVNSYVCKPTDYAQLLQIVNAIGRYWFDTVELPPAH
jgi:CheY-like chemotaxis protein